MMKDCEFVSWVADRMVHVYGESPNVDFVHRARAVAENIARYDLTTDACESLRARLSKYEDAEGRPVSTIAEQAREIERLKTNMDTLHRAHCELAALKAQPSGVVLPDALGRAFITCESGDAGYCVVIKSKTLQEAQQVHNWLARLNQQPARAGVVDERAAFEARFSKVYDLDFDEETEGYKDHGDQALWYGWQARAARSAPSHGEQVREAVLKHLLDAEPYLTEKVHYTCDAAGDYRNYYLELYVPTPAKAPEPFDVAVAKWLGLATTPSAGSQEQGE